MNLLFDWVRFGLKFVGATEVWGELASQVQKTITILDKPDYIGSTNIKWWDPNDYVRTVGAGFTITINHNSNNN